MTGPRRFQSIRQHKANPGVGRWQARWVKCVPGNAWRCKFSHHRWVVR